MEWRGRTTPRPHFGKGLLIVRIRLVLAPAWFKTNLDSSSLCSKVLKMNNQVHIHKTNNQVWKTECKIIVWCQTLALQTIFFRLIFFMGLNKLCSDHYIQRFACTQPLQAFCKFLHRMKTKMARICWQHWVIPTAQSNEKLQLYQKEQTFTQPGCKGCFLWQTNCYHNYLGCSRKC